MSQEFESVTEFDLSHEFVEEAIRKHLDNVYGLNRFGDDVTIKMRVKNHSIITTVSGKTTIKPLTKLNFNRSTQTFER